MLDLIMTSYHVLRLSGALIATLPAMCLHGGGTGGGGLVWIQEASSCLRSAVERS